MNKCIFLDRDGVLNVERGDYTFLPEDFKIMAGAHEALTKIKEAGYLVAFRSRSRHRCSSIYLIIRKRFADQAPSDIADSTVSVCNGCGISKRVSYARQEVLSVVAIQSCVAQGICDTDEIAISIVLEMD